jgi:hypothetical protein
MDLALSPSITRWGRPLDPLHMSERVERSWTGSMLKGTQYRHDRVVVTVVTSTQSMHRERERERSLGIGGSAWTGIVWPFSRKDKQGLGDAASESLAHWPLEGLCQSNGDYYLGTEAVDARTGTHLYQRAAAP